MWIHKQTGLTVDNVARFATPAKFVHKVSVQCPVSLVKPTALAHASILKPIALTVANVEPFAQQVRYVHKGSVWCLVSKAKPTALGLV